MSAISDKDAAEMVRTIKGYRLLQGYRRHAPADIIAVEDLLLRVARLVEEAPEIAELDLNPIMVLPPGRRLSDRRRAHSYCIMISRLTGVAL